MPLSPTFVSNRSTNVTFEEVYGADGFFGAPCVAAWPDALALQGPSLLPRIIVAEGKALAPARVMDFYGHFRTRQALRDECEYRPRAKDVRAATGEVKEALKAADQLAFIKEKGPGAMLCVIRLFSDPATSHEFIAILGNPTVALDGHLADGDSHGIIYSDVVSPETISGQFPADCVDLADPHVALLAGLGLRSRSVPTASMESYLEQSVAMFFPTAELLNSRVTVGDGVHPRAFLFSSVPSAPIGMLWPMGTKLEFIRESILLAGASFDPFILALDKVKSDVEAWLSVCAAAPTSPVALPCCFWSSIGPSITNSLADGLYPASVLDHAGVSRLVETRNLYCWRLHCDRVLSDGSTRLCFRQFLLNAQPALDSETMYGVALPSHLCPGFGVHFKCTDTWPFAQDPIGDFGRRALASVDCCRYDAVMVSALAVRPLSEPLRNSYDRTRLATRALTVDSSVPESSPVDLPTPAFVTPGPAQDTAGQERPSDCGYSSAPPAVSATFGGHVDLSGGVLPSESQGSFFSRDFSWRPTPVPPSYHAGAFEQPVLGGSSTVFSPSSVRPPPPQVFKPVRQSPLFPMGNPVGSGSHGVPPSIKLEDLSIATPQSRSKAPVAFLNVCRLLSHHIPDMPLFEAISAQPLPDEAKICPRVPRALAMQCILGPVLSPSSQPDQILPLMEEYMKAQGVDLRYQYNPGFFTAATFTVLLHPGSWQVGHRMDPTGKFPHSFHPFDLLQLLRDGPATRLLPADGISWTDARAICFAVSCMFSVFLAQDAFHVGDFDTTLLGGLLGRWTARTNDLQVAKRWQEERRRFSYEFFRSASMLFDIFRQWLQPLAFGSDLGFYDAIRHDGSALLMIRANHPISAHTESTGLLDAIASHARYLQQVWYTELVLPHSAIWAYDPPPDRFQAATSASTKRSGTTLQSDRRPPQPGPTSDSSSGRAPFSFTSTKPLFELVDMPTDGTSIPAHEMIRRLPADRSYRHPQVKDPSSGQGKHICYAGTTRGLGLSCSGGCRGRPSDKFKNGRSLRLHVCLSSAKWSTGVDWSSVIEFLKNPGVKKVLKPSPELLALLPDGTHLPPAFIRCRWPGQGDFQWLSSGTPSLSTVLPWIDPFLSPGCRAAVRRSTSALSGPLRFFDLPLTRPWQPMRRRRWGFGAISRDRSIHQDKPSGFLFIHFAWPFLTHDDRAVAASSHLYWDLYASMRLQAARRSVSVLRQPRPAPTVANLPTKLSMPRALLFACALLRFDFCYGDLQRWLAGEYTNRFRDWPASFRNLWNMCERPPFDDQPPPQWERAFRICTEGAPLRGHYCPTLAELAKRDAYDNHAPVRENVEDVESKFAKEEFKSYHVALPRFLLWFIPGVMLNPLQWAVRYGKGRICVDCTNGPSGKGSQGSPNTFVPPPREDTDDCPQVYYATAWQRLLRYAWRLRATFPTEDILGHCDDIDAAFRRVLYHPDMAPAFSYVFGAFLLIAVGQVFGSRHAPSHFTILSELRSYVASCGSVPSSISDPLVDATEIVASPQDVPLAPAVTDSINPRLNANEIKNFLQSTFVDDNGKAARRAVARQALLQSVIAAHELFGYAHEDRRDASMNEDKWGCTMGPVFQYLGMTVDFHRMLVTWPLPKRASLKELLDRLLADGSCTYVDAARVIGKIRSAADISPWGVFIVWSISQALAKVVSAARGAARYKRFWTRNSLKLSRTVQADLRLLSTRLVDPDSSPLWQRPIGLLIDREPESVFCSDASYAGVGGWSYEVAIMWRITREALLNLGFAMKDLERWRDEPASPHADGLHINPLELLGLAINVWIALRFYLEAPSPPTGRVLAFLADNVSALACTQPLTFSVIASSLCGGAADEAAGLPPGGQVEHRSRPAEPIRPSDFSDMGLRYRAALPLGQLSDLPPTLQVAVASTAASFVHRARGHIRDANDRTHDSRARHFAAWLETFSVDRLHLQQLNNDGLLAILGTYLAAVKRGENLDANDKLSAQTLRNYVNAAADFLRTFLQREVLVKDPATLLQVRPALHPFLKDMITSRQAWYQPKPKKEPFTYDILKALIDSCWPDAIQFLTSRAAAVDWISVSLFTGSRVGEYAQHSLQSGQRFHTIPDNGEAGEWAGQAIAFLPADITFLDRQRRLFSVWSILDPVIAPTLFLVRIRFRYDKSHENFSVRQFARTGTPYLDIFPALERIIRRHSQLGASPSEPLGVYSDSAISSRCRSDYSFLRDYHITTTLRHGCTLAYPDPDHYLRRNILSLVAHSNRVTAAVCLHLGGASLPDIAFKLRWSEASVKTYLRDAYQNVGRNLAATVRGAFGTASEF